MISIRKAGIADFEMLASLCRSTFEAAFGKFNDPQDMSVYLDTAFAPDTIRQQLEDENVIYYIATLNNENIGYAKLRRNSSCKELPDRSCMQLERIYLKPDHIGKKNGKMIMDHCIAFAKKEKFDYIWLGVWQQNEQAIEFYKKAGFSIIGFKQFILGKEVNDDFVMALEL